ncbi:MAG: hypothetical protein K2X93_04095 [Candidatus Obscuribacterales bacterium]|nr:hypothetical protein [Candidatus Obscuribacterales bacterium]
MMFKIIYQSRRSDQARTDRVKSQGSSASLPSPDVSSPSISFFYQLRLSVELVERFERTALEAGLSRDTVEMVREIGLTLAVKNALTSSRQVKDLPKIKEPELYRYLGLSLTTLTCYLFAVNSVSHGDFYD